MTQESNGKGQHMGDVVELQDAMDQWQEGVDEVELFNAGERGSSGHSQRVAPKVTRVCFS